MIIKKAWKPVLSKLVLFLFLLGICLTAEVYAEKFTVIAIPDTQFLSEKWPERFTAMTQWIADNKEVLNIEFVLHEGDIVQNYNLIELEWQRANTSMSILDGVVPYVLAVGNHDFNIPDRESTTLFNKYFPVTRYEDLPTFGGVKDAGKYDNSYHLFSAGGVDWLVISLIYDPLDSELNWAGQVVSNYPNRQVILLTHSYMVDSERNATGENIWNKFVKLYKNVSFTVSGHLWSSRIVEPGINGNTVYQMGYDAQNRDDADRNTYLRIIEFDTAQNKVSVKTYSPLVGNYWTSDRHQFVFENVEFMFSNLSPHRIECRVNPESIYANGIDLSTVEAKICNVNGYTVIDATNSVSFSISGEGTWEDGTTGEKQVNAVSGVATIKVKAIKTPGTITVIAGADNLIDGVVEVTTMGEEPRVYDNFFDPLQGKKGKITYKLIQNGHVTIKIYTLTEELVRTLFDGEKDAGTYSPSNDSATEWDGKNDKGDVVANGIYILKIKLNDSTYIRKFGVLRRAL